MIAVKGFRFSKEWLASVSLKKAQKTAKNEPNDVVEEAWNLANGIKKPPVKRKTSTAKKKAEN
jgi:hypothetical protein